MAEEGCAAPDAGPPGAPAGEAAGGGRWTDSHCHLQDSYLPASEELGAVLARAVAAGIGRIVCVGTDRSTSGAAVALAREVAASDRPAPQAWATIGLHHHEASQGTEAIVALADELGLAGSAPPGGRPPGSVVGIGECGLDYHYEHSPRRDQRRAFAEQIELARRLGLTLVVHTRDAWDDTLTILEEQGAPERTIIHCFTGGPAEAERCVALGAYLSFSGIVTFRSADEVREAARRCPSDRLLVETDAPFLAPVPHRGRPNEPALVGVVGEALAAVRGEPAEALAASSWSAAATAFRLG